LNGWLIDGFNSEIPASHSARTEGMVDVLAPNIASDRKMVTEIKQKKLIYKHNANKLEFYKTQLLSRSMKKESSLVLDSPSMCTT
jgi:hypothetical protein